MSWPFSDPPEVTVFTSRDIVERGNWIHFVGHDADDGAWQFLSINGAPESELDARLMLLRNIVELDPTLREVADLPLGWIAWRNAKGAEWKRRQR